MGHNIFKMEAISMVTSLISNLKALESILITKSKQILFNSTKMGKLGSRLEIQQ